MTATDTLQARQRGFSLVELMVAIAIGLFLLAGAITIFTTSKRTYLEQGDMARIQEGLRVATDLSTRALRRAGEIGCAYGINPARLTVEPALAAAATLFDLTRGPIQGNEGGAGAPWLPTPTGGAVENMADPMPLTVDNEAISPVAGSDAITIRHAGGSKWEVTAAMGAATDDVAVNNTASNYCLDETGAVVSCNAAAAVLVLGGSGQTIATNDVVAIASCSAVDVFRASPATGTALSHAAALSGTYGTDAVVSRGTLVRYFVGTDPAGEPGLYREEPNPGGVNLTRS
ncbi:MAG: PilW family protein, partial [Chromatiales bacterium]